MSDRVDGLHRSIGMHAKWPQRAPLFCCTCEAILPIAA